MTNSQGHQRKHLANSPFKQAPEPTIEVFEMDDRVSHDLYGLGRIVGLEAHAVAVDFGEKRVRVTSPYSKLHHL